MPLQMKREWLFLDEDNTNVVFRCLVGAHHTRYPRAGNHDRVVVRPDDAVVQCATDGEPSANELMAHGRWTQTSGDVVDVVDDFVRLEERVILHSVIG